MASTHFLVRGRVQGVGFRAWARRLARRLDLTGFVRNCPDGSVEIEVAGKDDHVDQFRAALRTGPPSAIVSNVVESPSQRPTPSDFIVLH